MRRSAHHATKAAAQDRLEAFLKRIERAISRAMIAICELSNSMRFIIYVSVI